MMDIPDIEIHIYHSWKNDRFSAKGNMNVEISDIIITVN